MPAVDSPLNLLRLRVPFGAEREPSTWMSIRGHPRVPDCWCVAFSIAPKTRKKGAPHEFTMRSRDARTLTGKRRPPESIRTAERQAAKRRQSAPAESRAPLAWNSRRRLWARPRREKLHVVPPTPTLGGLACTCRRGPKSSWRRWSCLPFLQESGAEPSVAGHDNWPQAATPHLPTGRRRVYWHMQNRLLWAGLPSIQVLSAVNRS